MAVECNIRAWSGGVWVFVCVWIHHFENIGMDPIFPNSTQDFYKHWNIRDCYDTWKKLITDPVHVTFPAYSWQCSYIRILIMHLWNIELAETFQRNCPLWVTANITQHFEWMQYCSHNGSTSPKCVCSNITDTWEGQADKQKEGSSIK